MRRRRIIQWAVVGVLVAVLVVVVVLRVTGCPLSGSRGDGGVIPNTAPDFSLPTLDGGTVELSQLRGKWVLLNFWTTWCHFCVVQQPYLQAAYDERAGVIEFVGINLGEGEERVRSHTDADITFTIALDTRQTTGTAYGVRYLPTLVLIDKEGVVRGIRNGAFGSKAELDAWLDQRVSG
ncbi:MAG: TlpA family protein disulfide reductase [Dehalococcoidia bacterium]